VLGSAFRKSPPGRRDTVERIDGWTRRRFALPEEVVVSIAQVECLLPGCPPIETVVSFWEGEQRYHFKIFKPLSQVEESDLPFSWMKESLAVAPGWQCDCC
jgi:hypothetical protein